MYVLLPSVKQNDFTTVELEVPDHILERVRSTTQEHELKLLIDKINRISIQNPFIQRLDEEIQSDLVEPLTERWGTTPQFYIVTTSLGCLPDPSCRFTWIRIGLNLAEEIQGGNTQSIVFNMYPETSQDEMKLIRSFEIGGNLGIKVHEIEAGGLSSTKTHKQEHSVFSYHVTTYGKMGANPVWDFRTTDVHPEIAGDITLIVVVAINPEQRIRGCYSLSAEVQLRSALPKFPLIMKRSKTDLEALHFVLNR